MNTTNYGGTPVILAFALVTIAGVAILVFLTRDKDKHRWFSPTLIKLYGLLSVAGLAALVAIATTDANAKTAVFTLLGTIAGYLAGKGTDDNPARPGDERSK